MKLENSEGTGVDLDVDNITMVVRGGLGFYVIGRRIHEEFGGDMDAFMAVLPNIENFVKLTWVGDGEPFWANATTVKQVRPIGDSIKAHYKDAQSDVTFTGGINRVVTEDPYDTCKRLNAAGANRLDF